MHDSIHKELANNLERIDGFLRRLAAANRADFATMKKAVAYATAVSSLTVESFSVNRLSTAGRATIDRRYRELVAMTKL